VTPPSAARFITVLVEEHPALPEGCCMRFKLVDEPRPVRAVRYESEAAPDVEDWLVESAGANGAAGEAWTATVEDSGAGTCMLVYGSDHGLRLRPRRGGPTVAEPYLLLAPDALMD
jgi:hypothetical protein